MVGFTCFIAGSLALARFAGLPTTWSVPSLTVRAVVALVVAALMLVSERRRLDRSFNSAAIDGLQIAAIVIVASNLSGSGDSGIALALRSATVLVAVPAMAVATYLMARSQTGP